MGTGRMIAGKHKITGRLRPYPVRLAKLRFSDVKDLREGTPEWGIAYGCIVLPCRGDGGSLERNGFGCNERKM